VRARDEEYFVGVGEEVVRGCEADAWEALGLVDIESIVLGGLRVACLLFDLEGREFDLR
jgi:hypothetical protein